MGYFIFVPLIIVFFLTGCSIFEMSGVAHVYSQNQKNINSNQDIIQDIKQSKDQKFTPEGKNKINKHDKKTEMYQPIPNHIPGTEKTILIPAEIPEIEYTLVLRNKE